MKAQRLISAFFLAWLLLLGLAGRAFAVPPAAPAILAPANGASVQIPFTLQWSAVNDPTIIAYNWQVSPSSTFSPVVKNGSTNGATQAALSGLANGTYFVRVQAVNNGFEQGAWSATRSFTVSGASAQAPGVAQLAPPVGYSTFHPFESMRFTWSAVPGAVSYIFEAATDARFPVLSTLHFDNIPDPQYGFAIGNPEGNYTARVFAVNADGTVGQPSNTIQFSVFFNNPVPPAPQPVSPANGVTLTLPITFQWTPSINPQDLGYEFQISTRSDFATTEELAQVTLPPTNVVSQATGTI
jgi:predicted phage tail protein